jgi:hypothetical protein
VSVLTTFYMHCSLHLLHCRGIPQAGLLVFGHGLSHCLVIGVRWTLVSFPAFHQTRRLGLISRCSSNNSASCPMSTSLGLLNQFVLCNLHITDVFVTVLQLYGAWIQIVLRQFCATSRCGLISLNVMQKHSFYCFR